VDILLHVAVRLVRKFPVQFTIRNIIPYASVKQLLLSTRNSKYLSPLWWNYLAFNARCHAAAEGIPKQKPESCITTNTSVRQE
jgi:hypothetical protein